MNKKTDKSPKNAGGPCLCRGTGPALSDLLRRLGPPEAARRHFETAQLEILKGLRSLLDARIERGSKSSGKGAKITVE
jgi:hypothetical protein